MLWLYHNIPQLVGKDSDSLGITRFFRCPWHILFWSPVLFFSEQNNGFIVYHRVTNTVTRSRYVASDVIIGQGVQTMWYGGEEDCAIMCHLEIRCAGFMYINDDEICQIWVTEASIVIAWLLTNHYIHLIVSTVCNFSSSNIYIYIWWLLTNHYIHLIVSTVCNFSCSNIYIYVCVCVSTELHYYFPLA